MKSTASSTNLSARVQDLHGELAWPTLVLFAVGTGGFLTSVVGVWLAWWSAPWAVASSTLCLYLLFTPAHEAVHGNIRGRSVLPAWAETFVGYISAGAFLFPYPIFSYVHRTHHKHTNHPERDPDYWVASRNPVRVLLGCASMLPEYYYFYFSRTKLLLSSPSERPRYFATLACLVAIPVVFALWASVRGIVEPVLLWLVPALLASTFLAYIFDYLPHRPHTERRRYLDTRVTLFPGADVLFASQNLHLIHHLYPSIPFYRYRSAFTRLRPELEERGARIDDFTLGSTLSPDAQQSA